MFVFGSQNNYDRAMQPEQVTYSLVVKGPHKFNGPKYNGLNSPTCASPAPKVFKLAPAPCGRFPGRKTPAAVDDEDESTPMHFVFPTVPLTPGPTPNIIDLDAAMANLYDQHVKQHGTAMATHYDRYCPGWYTIKCDDKITLFQGCTTNPNEKCTSAAAIAIIAKPVKDWFPSYRVSELDICPQRQNHVSVTVGLYWTPNCCRGRLD